MSEACEKCEKVADAVWCEGCADDIVDACKSGNCGAANFGGTYNGHATNIN